MLYGSLLVLAILFFYYLTYRSRKSNILKNIDNIIMVVVHITGSMNQ